MYVLCKGFKMRAKTFIYLLLSLEVGTGFITKISPALKYESRSPHHQYNVDDRNNCKHHKIDRAVFRVRARPLSFLFLIPPPDSIETLMSDVQAQTSLLNDVANVVLQAVTIFDPSTFLLRLAVVVSQILAVYAEYLPHKEIAPDRLFFDAIGLVTACFRFRRSVQLSFMGITETLTSQDERVYKLLFEPVGITLRQFKTLKATSMDWVNVLPNMTLVGEDEVRLLQNVTHWEEEENEEYLYWLFQGDAELVFRGNICYEVERTMGVSIDDPTSIGLIGDMRFSARFDVQFKRINELKKNTFYYFLYKCGFTDRFTSTTDIAFSDMTDGYDDYLWATYKTGKSGATLLRINTNECLKTINDDDDLATSFRLLMMKSMQRKVTALLKSQYEKEQNKVS